MAFPRDQNYSVPLFLLNHLPNVNHITMDANDQLDNFEIELYKTLHSFLLEHKEVDPVKPDAPDLDGIWLKICQSYIPDGVREFAKYPIASLGWMMYTGMALARFWDIDWATYSANPDLYLYLRDKRGFDHMDEYISEEVLGLADVAAQKLQKLVESVAELAHNALLKEGFEPCTQIAFLAFVRTLHQMYLAGLAVQLLRMGYKMRKL